MACCHYAAPSEDGDKAFSVDVSAITYGPGVLAEVGVEDLALPATPDRVWAAIEAAKR